MQVMLDTCHVFLFLFVLLFHKANVIYNLKDNVRVLLGRLSKMTEK